MWHFAFVHIFAIDKYSKFFHRLTLQTICNNVIIMYFTTP